MAEDEQITQPNRKPHFSLRTRISDMLEKEPPTTLTKDVVQSLEESPEDPSVSALQVRMTEALKAGKKISHGQRTNTIDTSKLSPKQLKELLDSFGDGRTDEELKTTMSAAFNFDDKKK